jgi:hypothetical protein
MRGDLQEVWPIKEDFVSADWGCFFLPGGGVSLGLDRCVVVLEAWIPFGCCDY